MTTFFIIRHCESDWHVQGILAGQANKAVLTVKGKRQAEKIAEYLKDFDIDIIYSSKLKRAIQTAKIIAKILNKKVVKDTALNERNWGDLQRKFDKEIQAQLESRFINTPPNGESFKQFEKRILSFLNTIKNKHLDEKVLLVTHGGVIEAIEKKFKSQLVKKKIIGDVDLLQLKI